MPDLSFHKIIAYQAVIDTMRDIALDRRSTFYPHVLADFLPYRASARTVRRYMKEMASRGMITRVSHRGGYRLS